MAVLVRVFGDIDFAEDAVQDAFARPCPLADRRPATQPGWLDHHHCTSIAASTGCAGGARALDNAYAQAALLHAATAGRSRRVPCQTNGFG